MTGNECTKSFSRGHLASTIDCTTNKTRDVAVQSHDNDHDKTQRTNTINHTSITN